MNTDQDSVATENFDDVVRDHSAAMRKIIPLSPSVVKKLRLAGRFPPAIALSPRARAYKRSTLLAWVREREAEGADAARKDREAIARYRKQQEIAKHYPQAKKSSV